MVFFLSGFMNRYSGLCMLLLVSGLACPPSFWYPCCSLIYFVYYQVHRNRRGPVPFTLAATDPGGAPSKDEIWRRPSATTLGSVKTAAARANFLSFKKVLRPGKTSVWWRRKVWTYHDGRWHLSALSPVLLWWRFSLKCRFPVAGHYFSRPTTSSLFKSGKWSSPTLISLLPASSKIPPRQKWF